MASSSDPDMPAFDKGKYMHSKTGNYYEVIAVAMHSETHEPLVVYKPLYDSKYELFARPFDSFIEEVVLDGVKTPRFVRIHE